VRIAVLLLPGLLYAAPAMAEGERESKAPSTTGSALGPKVWPAPVGHRQPTRADIPKGLSNEPEEPPRNREIDALLQISTAERPAAPVEIVPWSISRQPRPAKPAPATR
jgi:hypothetical protein